jgi:hypothetical protein
MMPKSREGGECASRDLQDKAHELLIAQLELQRCAASYARRVNIPYGEVIPWKCEDERVQEAWNILTHPTNAHALIEVVNSGSYMQPRWWEIALEHCQRRAGHEKQT